MTTAPDTAPDTGSDAPFETDPLAGDVRLLVARMARRFRQTGVRTGDDLTASRMSALVSISRHGPIALGELAAIEGVQPPNMTRTIAHLEEAALVRREVDANDRRIGLVRLTSEGQRAVEAHWSSRNAFLAERIARLDRDDREALRRAVMIMSQLLEEPEH
jgi:DNA-binding MarR family transcriptional regulator